MATIDKKSNKQNLLSAPSTSDKSESENVKFSKSNNSIFGSIGKSLTGIFSSNSKQKFEKPVDDSNVQNNTYDLEDQRSTEKPSYLSSLFSQKSSTTKKNTTDEVLENDNISSSYTSSSKTIATGSGLVFGLSLTFFMQIILLIIVLAILGINILHYLGYGIETAGDVINATGDAITKIGEVGRTTALPVTGKTVKQTAIVTGEGTKGAVDVTVGAIDKSVDLVTGETGTDLNKVNSKYKNKSNYIDNTVDLALEKQPAKKNKNKDNTKKKELEGGWCYIGSEEGVRSCASLEEGVECKSGGIFGNREVCINPNLRE